MVDVSPNAGSSNSGGAYGRGSEVQLSELEDEERDDRGGSADSSSSLEGAPQTTHQPLVHCCLTGFFAA